MENSQLTEDGRIMRLAKKVYPEKEAENLKNNISKAIFAERESSGEKDGSSDDRFKSAKEELKAMLTKLAETSPYKAQGTHFEGLIMELPQCHSLSSFMDIVEEALSRADFLDKS